ncbi:hypothetical protein M0802_007098 [Mischocyttarus mexicanus]|nr:hypothetical protein M0802_007098 [Mischocyttarus mexicanus]
MITSGYATNPIPHCNPGADFLGKAEYTRDTRSAINHPQSKIFPTLPTVYFDKGKTTLLCNIDECNPYVKGSISHNSETVLPFQQSFSSMPMDFQEILIFGIPHTHPSSRYHRRSERNETRQTRYVNKVFAETRANVRKYGIAESVETHCECRTVASG